MSRAAFLAVSQSRSSQCYRSMVSPKAVVVSSTPRRAGPTTGALPSPPSGRRDRAGPLDDQPVVLGPPVLREVEHRLLVPRQRSRSQARGRSARRRPSTPSRRSRPTARRSPTDRAGRSLLASGLGHADDPRGVLIGAGPAWRDGCGSPRGDPARAPAGGGSACCSPAAPARRLQPHHPVGLGPAAVVADAHADDGAAVPRDGPAEIATSK